MLPPALISPSDCFRALLRRISAAKRMPPPPEPAEPPLFSRVPYTTGDPREDARTAAWAAEGSGVLADADRVPEADLEGFTVHARQQRGRG
jgi:hypothetical protein